jgi:2-methylisocitrate lyase-like PEP mutase family enzyme
MGFQMIVRPLSGLFAATRALEDAYGAVRRDGDSRAIRDRLLGFDGFNAIIGLDQRYALDDEFRSDDAS